jgi:hypothetical protein
MRECHASQLRMRMRCRMARVSTQSTQTKAFVQHSYSVGCALVVHCAAAAKRLALLFSRGKLSVSALVAALYPMRAIHSSLLTVNSSHLQQLPFGTVAPPYLPARRVVDRAIKLRLQLHLKRKPSNVASTVGLPMSVDRVPSNAKVGMPLWTQMRHKEGSPGADVGVPVQMMRA